LIWRQADAAAAEAGASNAFLSHKSGFSKLFSMFIKKELQIGAQVRYSTYKVVRLSRITQTRNRHAR